MTFQLNYNLIQPPVSYSFSWPAGNTVPTIYVDVDKWPMVANQVRGYYEYNASSGWTSVLTKPAIFDRVAIILESPHKDEFDNLFNPLIPLNGVGTRARFCNKILAKLSQWLPNGAQKQFVEVMLFNPVPYQASLYHLLNNRIPTCPIGQSLNYYRINKDLRDGVWRWLFNNCRLCQNFISDITNYNPYLIANCCTGRKGKNNRTTKALNNVLARKRDSLNFEVLSAIKNAKQLHQVQYVEDSHPCCW